MELITAITSITIQIDSIKAMNLFFFVTDKKLDDLDLATSTIDYKTIQ